MLLKKRKNANNLPPTTEQDFAKIIQNDFIYVDKTEYLYKLIDSNITYFFLARPRRFGKSLLISALKEIFRGNQELFTGLYIYNKIKWNSYPIIHIDFLSFYSEEASLNQLLIKKIKDIAKKFDIILDSEIENQLFEELIIKINKKYKKKVVVLIDEYDYPIINNIDNIDVVLRNRNVLKAFYSILKSCDQYLRFVFITGISKFSQTSIFSGLNNLNDISFDKNYYGITGLTEDELQKYFPSYIDKLSIEEQKTKEEILSKIKYWYNGYSWNGVNKVYNIFSILNLFDKLSFMPYWFETAIPSVLVKFIKKQKDFNIDFTDITIDPLMLTTSDVESIQLIPLLFQTGYLTISQVIKTENDMLYILNYPNYEVRKNFINYIFRDFNSNNVNLIRNIIDSLKNNDIDKVMLYLHSIIASIPNYIFDYQNESYYHSIIHAVFTLLFDYSYAEVSTNIGRIDEVVELNNGVFIFEFKLTSKEEAMRQIKQKRYFDKYKIKNKPIFLIAVGISKEDRNIKDWVIERIDG
ncbi:MAG: hypothetical protein A2Y34_01550 [Spirochaetes bacterium GWC1_27_15]|nr:MAG: hypothetical protein A2Z98_07570 [Spirochaetes bacterium GWB1_27_13]OHD21527.1 MAG: hypothetical protein A2Y34_01550 [Spirochaetes bacterium GWC1_27_15]